MGVEEAIYVGYPIKTHSIIMMKGIIDSLSKDDKTALKSLSEKLQHLRNNSASDEEIEEAYSELSSYLHQKYLQEVLGAHPRIKETGHLG